MKKALSTLILSTGIVWCFAQPASLLNTYPEAFMKVVKAHNEEGLNKLYTDSNVNLYVTRKTKDSAKILYKTTSSGWAETIGITTYPHELRITELNFEAFDNMAVSEARFDEYDDNKHGQDGYDLFTYFRTDKGWKINHMNVSIAFDFDNLPEQVENVEDSQKLSMLNRSIIGALTGSAFKESDFIDNACRADIGLYKSGNFVDLLHLKRSEFQEFLNSKFKNKIEVNNSKLRTLDGYLAYTTAELYDLNKGLRYPLIITYINHGSAWYCTSFQISLQE